MGLEDSNIGNGLPSSHKATEDKTAGRRATVLVVESQDALRDLAQLGRQAI